MVLIFLSVRTGELPLAKCLCFLYTSKALALIPIIIFSPYARDERRDNCRTFSVNCSVYLFTTASLYNIYGQQLTQANCDSSHDFLRALAAPASSSSSPAPVTLTFEFDTGISFQARYAAYQAQHAPPPNSLPVTRRPRSPLVTLPGTSESEYHVVVGYGTPAQNLTVGFDAGAGGATLLHCKTGAFDPSGSSSVAHVPCGSPDCPLEACSGPSCASTTVVKNGAVISSITVVTHTLTFSRSTPTTVDNFRANCMETGGRTADRSSGLLDLSRDSHSLASRATSSPDTAAFSYCLPSPWAARGFLSIGAPLPGPERKVSYTPLRSNAALPNAYLVRLAGLSLGTGGPVIPIPAGDALMALRTTFTYLMPETYAALRDQFKEQMAQYPVAPPMGFLDTCYNFTGLRMISVPPVTLMFDSGASLELGIRQTMYFEDRDYVFSPGCLAFAAPAWAVYPAGVAAVIGTLAQETTEVVYDVHAGKVGFAPDRCGQ